jgi:hypothetical protein
MEDEIDEKIKELEWKRPEIISFDETISEMNKIFGMNKNDN